MAHLVVEILDMTKLMHKKQLSLAYEYILFK